MNGEAFGAPAEPRSLLPRSAQRDWRSRTGRGLRTWCMRSGGGLA